MGTYISMQRNIVQWRRELAQVKRFLEWRSSLQSKAGYKDEQPRDERGRWTSEGGVEVTTSSGFLTGIQSIDETSQALSDILVRVIEGLDFLPETTPQLYGTAVHVAFGLAVRGASLPGVGDIERSFNLDDSDPHYGLVGTVRTDVTYRNAAGEIMAIYDVKTGDRRMSVARANELREKTGAAPNTPVFELNVVRGISRKYWLPVSLLRHQPYPQLGLWRN